MSFADGKIVSVVVVASAKASTRRVPSASLLAMGTGPFGEGCSGWVGKDEQKAVEAPDLHCNAPPEANAKLEIFRWFTAS